MPNTPALVRNGASVFVAGEKASKSDIEITKQLLQSVGTCEQVTENYLDPITALSGSGPAYVRLLYLIINPDLFFLHIINTR